MARWSLALILLLGPTSVEAEGVRGVVHDPQGRVVEGAQVELSCTGRSIRTVTRDRGDFSVATAEVGSSCDLTVRQPGFEPWRRTVHPPVEAIAVRLRIAAIRQEIDVTPPRETDALSSLSSTQLSVDALVPLGPDSRLWLDFALSAAGAFTGRREIYVDGLPADAAPHAVRIRRVSINADPFSAEIGGVDRNRIDIETRPPDRKWRFNIDGLSWAGGGGDALASRPAPQSRRRSGGVSGPVPGLPLTFFVQGGAYSVTEYPTFLALQPEGLTLEATSPATTRIGSWSAGTTLSRTGYSWSTMADGSDMRLTNAAVGGLTAPSAGGRSATLTRRVHSSWWIDRGAGLHQRGGMILSRHSTESTASSTYQARTYFGQLNTAGSDGLSGKTRATQWSARHVVEGAASDRPWSAGAEISRASAAESSVINPLGRLYLENPAASHGTWIVHHGVAAHWATATTAAVFFQSTPLVREKVLLRAGVRGDWEAGEGLFVSPRATFMTRARGLVIASSAGLFIDPWSPAFLLEILSRADRDLQIIIVRGVSTSDGPLPDQSAGERLTLRVQPGVARRRDLVVQTSVMRRIGRVDAGIEHRWTRGMSLAGSVRVRTPAGLEDLIDSDRRLVRSQLHARAGFTVGIASVTGHYELDHSSDDTDGAFALPARQADIRGEWGRSTDAADHNASLVASLTLPGAVRALVRATASSGMRYSVVTGRDPDGLAAFMDRAGAARNSMVGPAYRNLSLYASRRFRIPRTSRLGVDLGVRAENVFDRTNVLAVVRVAGTDWLGKPLTASPGRSIGVWLTVAQ